MQVQDIVCFIKYIQRSKPYANQIRNVFNANIGYSSEVETVYLPGQWSHLLKQGNAGARAVNSIFRTFIASVHNLKVVQLCPIHTVSGSTTGSLIFVSDILVGAFGKKCRLKAEINPILCIKHLVIGIRQEISRTLKEKPEIVALALQVRIFGKTPLSPKKRPKKISKKSKKKLTSDKRGFTFYKM